MKKSILIGVTQRVDLVESHNEIRDALDENLINWLKGLGCMPVPIPNTLIDVQSSNSASGQSRLKDWLQSVNIQGFVLSGGNNIGEFPQRDITENYLLAYAERNQLPVLGLCRGMQIIGLWAGGELIEISHHVRTRHNLQVASNTGQWPESVNSFHNFSLKECPNGFKILANSEDGYLEAIKHNILPWEAWMWHPEREDVFSEADCNRFKSLFNI